jgi:hypothetical protein
MAAAYPVARTTGEATNRRPATSSALAANANAAETRKVEP